MEVPRGHLVAGWRKLVQLAPPRTLKLFSLVCAQLRPEGGGNQG